MKKILGLFLIYICLFVIKTSYVSAKSWQCPYKFDDGSEYTYEIDNEAGTMIIINPKESSGFIFDTYTYNYSIVTGTDEIKSYKDDYCPVLYLVKVENFYQSCSDGNPPICWNDYTYSYTTYTDSFIRESRPDECVEQRDSFCLSKFLGGLGFSSTTSYFEGRLDKDNPLSDGKTTGSTCPSWLMLEKDIRDAYESYKNCTTSSCSSYIGIANSSINELKVVCNNMLSYRDVYTQNGNEIIEDACIQSCLKLGENINSIKEEYGIGTDSGDGKCGFSDRLSNFIRNIIKWGKYLIPVIVIVFGILDFIKAIGADKDDEMKKAQGRFVKRLIAAALIFIVPFIIEFVLDKMGFGVNDCGIIDL